MPTPLFDFPEVAGSVVSFAQLNIIQRLQEAIAQAVIVDALTIAPAVPTDGVMYRVASPATGVWTGEEDNLAINVSGAWYFADMTTINKGYGVFNQQALLDEVWTGSSWVISPSGNGVHTESLTASGNLTYAPVIDITATAGLTMFLENISMHGLTKIKNSGANNVTVEGVTVLAGMTQDFFTSNGTSWSTI